jgi:hypothetical protein
MLVANALLFHMFKATLFQYWGTTINYLRTTQY